MWRAILPEPLAGPHHVRRFIRGGHCPAAAPGPSFSPARPAAQQPFGDQHAHLQRRRRLSVSLARGQRGVGVDQRGRHRRGRDRRVCRGHRGGRGGRRDGREAQEAAGGGGRHRRRRGARRHPPRAWGRPPSIPRRFRQPPGQRQGGAPAARGPPYAAPAAVSRAWLGSAAPGRHAAGSPARIACARRADAPPPGRYLPPSRRGRAPSAPAGLAGLADFIPPPIFAFPRCYLTRSHLS
jgi:hypothetical protein